MFTKKKIVIFISALAVFLALDYWMFSALKSSYSKTLSEDQRQLVTAVARSAPADEADIDAWLDSASTNYQGIGLLYLRGVPGVDEEVSSYAKVDGLEALYEQYKDDESFAKGIEAAGYLETSYSEGIYRLGSSRVRLLFAPVPNESGDNAVGIVVAALDEARSASFLHLADALSLIALMIFALAFGIALFTRDPPTGYAIFVLFAIAAVFIAYPLLEAVKLTFLKDGRFSLSVWGTVLSNKQYLQALSGSVELGCVTATISTLVGFIFAFAVARTSIKGKSLSRRWRPCRSSRRPSP